MMRITIIGVDSVVGVDGVFRGGLDLSQCGLPENFWAFQWNEHGNNAGHIEYNSPLIQNDTVNEIPVWANACVSVWQAKLDQEAAEIEAERIAAEQMQQGS
jgi:predicted nicotinamide N-methyase